MLTVGIDLASSRRSLELASHQGVYAAAGVHPNLASGWSPGMRAEIASLPGLDGHARRSRSARWLDGCWRRQGPLADAHYRGLFNFFRGELGAATSRFVAGIRASDGGAATTCEAW